MARCPCILKRSFLCLADGVFRPSDVHSSKASVTHWDSQNDDDDKRRHIERTKKEGRFPGSLASRSQRLFECAVPAGPKQFEFWTPFA